MIAVWLGSLEETLHYTMTDLGSTKYALNCVNLFDGIDQLDCAANKVGICWLLCCLKTQAQSCVIYHTAGELLHLMNFDQLVTLGLIVIYGFQIGRDIDVHLCCLICDLFEFHDQKIIPCMVLCHRNQHGMIYMDWL